MKLDCWELESHESNQSHQRNEVFYIIVYPNGDRNQLYVATVQDFDVADYAIASRYWFNDENNGTVYASQLAKENGLAFQGTGVLD